MTSPNEPSSRELGAPAEAVVARPDAVEEASHDAFDNTVPNRGFSLGPVVGIGASAGGIAALLDFFRTVPPDSGLAFVVVLHLSPAHESTLPDLLARGCALPVSAAVDGEKILPNHVYVIPPARYLTCSNDNVRLTPFDGVRSKRNTVDIFFRSLADSYGPHAVAVVLSGVDGDGAIGMKRIKERGGLTIAQDPGAAEHAGMPESAIGTGMVDWVLPSSEMAQRIIEYLQTEARLELPPEDGPPVRVVERPSADGDDALRDALAFLRARTGRDFSGYKRATILRRIGRRMQVNAVETLPAYVTYLRTHPGEAGALLQDLLISVTNFFRDREAFEALAGVVPRLFDGKGQGDAVRVWVPACATGEEAYSIAMLLLEHAQSVEQPPALQVFACDLNDDAVQVARAGHYQTTITTDVSDERLKRFFVKEHDGYRVRRELRELVLFATHDLLKDAPFSRMDLVSCRNLLIYLERDAQHRIIETFHFALKPGGKLFLGSSEAIEESSSLFRAVDKKHRIYAQQPALRPGIPAPHGGSSLYRSVHAHEQTPVPAPALPAKSFFEASVSNFHPGKVGRPFDQAELAELHFKLVERYAPPSALVNSEQEIVHLSEHVGDYLKLTGGEPSMNLLRVVRPELRANVQAALFRAIESEEAAETPPVILDVGARRRSVKVRVLPAPEVRAGFMLVVFVSGEASEQAAVSATPPAAPDDVVRYLEREVEQLRARLRSTVEQAEASTEELKASNEELQAMNEELRSATEELETSREELQSTNEELSTVNQEMKGKMDELAKTNSDLQNLMASTSIATVFLDRQLTIMRYTPPAVDIFHLIPGDIGRPLAHLKHRLDYSDLLADAEKVLETLVPVERTITAGDRWYQARLQPYRSLEDHIGGVVLTLVDVTDRNRTSEALRLSEERLRLLVESAKEFAIFTLDPEGRVSSWSAGAEAVFGYKESEMLGQSADILFTAEDRALGAPKREARRARDEGSSENDRWHARKDGSLFFGSGSTTPLRDEGGVLRGSVKIMRDLTESKRTLEALKAQMEDLTRFNAAAVDRELAMIELKREVNALALRLGETARYVVHDEGPPPEDE